MDRTPAVAQCEVRRVTKGGPGRGWALAWLGVAGVGIINGGIHRTYINALGELPAHQVSGITFAALYAPYVLAVQKRRPFPDDRTALAVGGAWAAGAMAFDTLVGHYLAGDSWADVLRAYNLSEGRIWTLVLALIAAGPIAARHLTDAGRRSRPGA
jgi:hypothetical protein